MNLVGKIFVVLILFASVTFMAFAVAVYATHKNWKDLAENPQTGLKAQVEKKKTELSDAQAERDALAKRLSEEETLKRQKIAELETYRKTSEERVTELNQQRDDLDKKQQEAVAAMAASQENLDKLTKEVEGLRKLIVDTQTDRDKQFKEVVGLTDLNHEAKNLKTRVEERLGQVQQELADLRTRKIGAPPTLRGKVLAVNQNDLVEVSLGSDDGLHQGNTLEVYRGSSYLGRMQVLRTESDRAVGKVMPDSKKAPIQKGDDVATRFKVG